MKTIMTKGAMLIALLVAASCSETEIGVEPEPDGGDGQVALGINPNLKVEAGTKAATKSVVSGEKIIYTDYTSAPGLGVVVTNKSATGVYVPDGDAKHHVWYMGDADGANWKSIKEKKSTFAETAEVPYYLTKEVGKVYAYYPYSASVTSSLSGISSEAGLKIPVTVLADGTIDAETNNATKYWNSNAWLASSSVNKATKLSVAAETDYLFFAADYGRYVNNGHGSGKTYDPNVEPDNTDTNNPGYKIKLDMQHAMAMVSFRVYDGGGLSTNAVTFTKFEIKNGAEGSSPFKTGEGKMSLADGTITDASTSGTMTRTVESYTLMRQIESGPESASEFVQDGAKVNGKIVSKTVSALVYPTDFSEGDIEVAITLKEGQKMAEVYTVALPAIYWEAGQNYIYTFSAGRNKLTVMDVSVTKWNDKEQAEIPL